MPLEYCEYNAGFAKCKDWLEKNLPDLFADLYTGNSAYEILLFVILLIFINFQKQQPKRVATKMSRKRAPVKSAVGRRF